MKNKNLSWVGALFVFALLLWCTAVTPGKVADPATYTCAVYSTFFSLLPPVIAIVLALNTKEVYTSLLVGIASGALLYANGNLELALNTLFFNEDGGMITKLSDSGNVGILAFLVMLGILVALMNKAGGSAAFGRWAAKRIKTRVGAMFATFLLGVLIFVDDYFNCLTVGTVMRPICDRYNIARAKLAYIIDSTAAPVCIIAPVSSWAAAVGSSLQGSTAFESDMAAFIATIPWNFYALLCLLLIVFIVVTDFDFGPMRKSEERAAKGEQFTSTAATSSAEPPNANPHGTLWDMLVPIASLIVFCVLALMYSGGYWGADPKYHTFASALGNSSAAPSLVWASFGAVGIAFLMYVPRGLVPFTDFMSGLVEGMKLMLPANIILVLAWTLSGVCRDLLQTPLFVQSIVTSGGAEWSIFLPAVIFVIAAFLSFSTGTAWGTFGILIPIVVPVVEAIDPGLTVVALSATLAGSVFGDHCSPISDTTILSSAGSGCNHIEHVSTQMPYSLTVAFSACLGYVVAGLTGGNWILSITTAVVALIGTVLLLHFWNSRRTAAT